jgi:hypothetical protein
MNTTSDVMNFNTQCTYRLHWQQAELKTPKIIFVQINSKKTHLHTALSLTTKLSSEFSELSEEAREN